MKLINAFFENLHSVVVAINSYSNMNWDSNTAVFQMVS